ncbi:AbrB family looped-hinge helix DNA binding protein [Methylobacterium brachiatum]|jgi:AbrB family looped-hinge helix DNA binding protein|uniref:AbrB family looped-hinge helix DNA binding protein n=2 Tax=Methylobacterium brachiatum TaxID=269660 RepID=A0AAJ1WYW0_9HYPH|nr:AbrB/MazE/SpoVT family DNA-binding domain-containing protein [Methylobacterium brachiatum]MCB4805263.1 AbrB/MazE/SpoVT family DNA-binding domain-containing protein [Methylobacterium brachiatum]MDQ0546310.1 AbrB family looped-hinge helix DNA binding protein [Methylobacterium brachiatum]
MAARGKRPAMRTGYVSGRDAEFGMASQLAKIEADGTLVIPADFRRELGLSIGDTVMVELAEDGLRVRSLSAAVREAQAIVRDFAPADRSLADELIAERRAEAARE